MYKLMIVDDEYNIRNGIKNVIPWSEYGIRVVGDAKNGVEALKLIPTLQPDIVITDIYMDNMNGLELTERLNKQYPEIKVVILSGYDEFEYAKRAIELDVCAYVLKPVLPHELVEIIKKVMSGIEAERKIKEKISTLEQELVSSMEILRDRFLNELVEGKIVSPAEVSDRSDFLGIRIDNPLLGCLVFSINGYFEITADKTAREVEILVLSVKNIIDDVINNYYKGYVFNHDPGNIVAVVTGLEGNSKRLFEGLFECVEKARESIRNILNVTVTVGIGRFYDEPVLIRKSFMEAVRALDYKITLGKDGVISIDDVASISGNSFIYPLDEERIIVESLNDEDMEKVYAGIDAFFKNISEQNYPEDRLKVVTTQLFAVIAKKFMDLGVDIYTIQEGRVLDPYKIIERCDSLEEIKNWLRSVISKAFKKISDERESSIKSVIKKAMEYISENYANPEISLLTIAEHLYLSPTYFSKLYKKETGMSYIEFLTKVRIEEAKKLLKQSNIKIADIGQSVGYPNNQYFCTLFRKITGMSPMEFREKKVRNDVSSG